MDELERFKREINLAEIAAAEGYELDRRESSRSSLVMRRADGDKIILATDAKDGHAVYFSVKDGSDNGSVIDFLQRRRGLNLGQVRKALRPWLPVPFSFPTAQRPRPTLPKPEPIPRDRAALVAQWHRMAPYAGGYLEGRGLTPETVTKFSHRIRIDERGNVAFRHDGLDGLAGWELKNKGFTGYAGGGAKALFWVRVGVGSGDDSKRLVVAESAIDAMSYYQANPGPGLYLSFAGSLSPEQEKLLAHVLTQYPAAAVLAATDNDPQGEAFAALIRAHRLDAIRAASPVGKDWNDAIKPTQGTAPRSLPPHDR